MKKNIYLREKNISTRENKCLCAVERPTHNVLYKQK